MYVHSSYKKKSCVNFFYSISVSGARWQGPISSFSSSIILYKHTHCWITGWSWNPSRCGNFHLRRKNYKSGDRIYNTLGEKICRKLSPGPFSRKWQPEAEFNWIFSLNRKKRLAFISPKGDRGRSAVRWIGNVWECLLGVSKIGKFRKINRRKNSNEGFNICVTTRFKVQLSAVSILTLN